MKAQGKEKWKVLIVDDEPDVHDVTRLVLHDFSYMDKPVDIISAFSAREAELLIEEHPDVAVILLDAVMETDNAGLKFVEYLRKERGMSRVRIVLRTGQAGHAPERYVIDNYDIDDYKNKAELTSQRLYTTVRSALKNYRDLQTIDANRHGLEKIIECSPRLYKIESEEKALKDILSAFFQLMDNGGGGQDSSLSSEGEGFIVLLEEGGGAGVSQGTGRFEATGGNPPERLEEGAKKVFDLARETGKNHFGEDYAVLVLKIRNVMIGLCCLKIKGRLSENEQKIMEIFSHQAAAALDAYALYKRLLQSEKMAAVGQIAGGLLHDVKNAMAGIQLSTQLIKDPSVPLEKKTKICNIVAAKFSWIQEMVEDIFDFSRGWKNLRLEPMGVMEILNPVVEWLQSDSVGNAVSVKTKILFQGKVRVDGVKIKRCLSNLCKNALDAMLKAHQERVSELILSVEEREGRAFFSVSDNGCGIEKKHLSRIWEPFFTYDKKGGTGLGLPVVKQIIEGHAGTVRLDSQAGRGSTFTFDLEIVE